MLCRVGVYIVQAGRIAAGACGAVGADGAVGVVRTGPAGGLRQAHHLPLAVDQHVDIAIHVGARRLLGGATAEWKWAAKWRQV